MIETPSRDRVMEKWRYTLKRPPIVDKITIAKIDITMLFREEVSTFLVLQCSRTDIVMFSSGQ